MKTSTKDFAAVIRSKMAKDPELAASIEQEQFKVRIGEQIYGRRKEARLTQRELAELSGTRQSAISRLEHADYDGHSLTMLRRIAAALGCEIRLEFHDKPDISCIEEAEVIRFKAETAWQPVEVAPKYILEKPPVFNAVAVA